MKLDKEYWLVVYSLETGDFKNASWKDKSSNIEELSAKFEMKYPNYRVIHIGKGSLPPKTYRFLEYIN